MEFLKKLRYFFNILSETNANVFFEIFFYRKFKGFFNLQSSMIFLLI